MAMDETMSFKVERDKNIKAREILKEVHQALVEKGYNPINQIVGYILSAVSYTHLTLPTILLV